MKPPPVIFVLLVAAFAVGDFASLAYINLTHQRWPDLPGVILLGLVFSQQTLLAVWFTFSRWNIVVRLLISLAIVFGLTLVAAGATDGAEAVAPWFAIQLITMFSFAVPLWIAKLLRFRIGLEGEMYTASRLPGWQFSIWGLLSGTTAAAIAVRTARQVEMPLLPVGESIAFFGCLAMTGLLVFVIAMGIRKPAVAAMITLPVVVLLCPLAGIFSGRTEWTPVETPRLWAVFGFCFGATIAIAVLALRIAGYRLWRGPRRVPDVNGANVEDMPMMGTTVMGTTVEGTTVEGMSVEGTAAEHAVGQSDKRLRRIRS
jgi:hypothetical protein